MKYSILLAALMSLFLHGCGWIERQAANVTGGGTETCVDGVAYLQFASGASVKYNKNGTIATCQ